MSTFTAKVAGFFEKNPVSPKPIFWSSTVTALLALVALLTQLFFSIQINWLITFLSISAIFTWFWCFRNAHSLRSQTDVFRHIYQASPDTMTIATLDEGRFIEVNDVVLRILGLPREAIIGKTSVELGIFTPEHRQQIKTMMEQQGFIENYEFTIRAANGQPQSFWMSSTLIQHQGQPAILSIGRDITEIKQTQQALLDRESQFRLLVENTRDITWRVDLEGRFTYVNPSVIYTLGYTPEEVLGRSMFEFLSPAYHAEVLDRLMKRKAGTFILPHLQVETRNKTGDYVFLELNTTPLYDEQGQLCAIQGVARDISDRKRAEDRLIYFANHDPLTGLYSRRRFQEELEQQLQESLQSQLSAAVLFIDLDHFKLANDRYGHAVGDNLLKRVAESIQKNLRASDRAARLHGDEFGVILTQIGHTEALEIAERMMQTIATIQLPVPDGICRVGASIGIAMIPEHGQDTESVLANADRAMYQAKLLGRNQIHAYAPQTDRQDQDVLSWDQRIRQALETNAFQLYLQPIISLPDNHCTHYEALLRMTTGAGVNALPGDFLGTADRFGHMRAIDRVVINLALDQLCMLRAAGCDGAISINLSPRSIADPELLGILSQGLKTRGLDPAGLIIELTETAMVTDLEQAQAFIRKLRALGCLFALDDFGVGFSSLTYLKHLDIEFVKIDGSFIKGLLHNREDAILVRAIIDLAHALGRKVVAESVENLETLQRLVEEGVDYGQGYYIGAPMSLTELTQSWKIPDHSPLPLS